MKSERMLWGSKLKKTLIYVYYEYYEAQISTTQTIKRNLRKVTPYSEHLKPNK